MCFIDIINLSLSGLGVYGLIFSFHFLLPRHAIPCAATELSEARRLLDHAETVGASPHGNEDRATLAMYERIIILHNRLSPHGRTQLRESTSARAHGESSLSSNLPANFTCGLTCSCMPSLHGSTLS